MLRLSALILVTLLVVAAQATEYAEGQVWKYHTRPGEEQSLLSILRIDIDPEIGPIYHLQLDGLNIKSPTVSGGALSSLPHIPVDRDTLDGSVTELIRASPGAPDIPEGYWLWREAFDSGTGGVFNIPVSEIVQYVEEAINTPQ